MRTITLASTAALALGIVSFASHACVVNVTTQEHHSSIAQGLLMTLGERLEASTTISPIDSSGRYDLEWELIAAPAVDPHRYPQFPHRTAQSDDDDPRFHVFYVVLTDHQKKLLTAGYERCTEDGQECASRIVVELERVCGRMPNNSFKPTLLRKAA